MTSVWLHTHLPRLQSADPNPISVKIPGQRIEYAAWVSLESPQFRVYEQGRQRCVREGVRNVHAWVVGEEILRVKAEFLGEFHRTPKGYRKAVYDPFKGPFFVDSETLESVHSASWVIMSGKNVWYVPTEESS